MAEKTTDILIVDDSDINRSILREMFSDEYRIYEADNGDKAIEMIDRFHDTLSVVFLDLVMPGRNGLDVLSHMNAQGYIKFTPVILITGQATEAEEEKAYMLGVSDVIFKPFSRRIVLRRTKNVIDLFAEKNSIQNQLDKQTEALIESQKKLQSQNEFLVNALSSVVEFRNLESGEHVKRVKYFTRIMLKYLRAYYPEYGLTDEDAEYIMQASALHDLGKIAIPDSILLKPDRLTDEEFEIIKKHPIYGCKLLERFKQDNNKFYRYCYEICRHHHERYDGNGYPDGLKGDAIPISAQVISIIDVFDALISRRVYKDSFTIETAFLMIIHGECGQFSPNIINCLNLARNELTETVDFLNTIGINE